MIASDVLSQVQGLALKTSVLPMLIDYDETREAVYWYDMAEKVIRKDSIEAGKEDTVTVLEHGESSTALLKCVNSAHGLIDSA